eukprot:scaffold103074_cov59-Phaeocystis_antarctica.AAC.2
MTLGFKGRESLRNCLPAALRHLLHELQVPGVELERLELAPHDADGHVFEGQADLPHPRLVDLVLRDVEEREARVDLERLGQGGRAFVPDPVLFQVKRAQRDVLAERPRQRGAAGRPHLVAAEGQAGQHSVDQQALRQRRAVRVTKAARSEAELGERHVALERHPQGRGAALA